MFEMGSVKNAAQFIRSLLNIVDFVQMKYNNEVCKAIRILSKPTFIHLEMPWGVIKTDKGNKKVTKPNFMEVFV